MQVLISSESVVNLLERGRSGAPGPSYLPFFFILKLVLLGYEVEGCVMKTGSDEAWKK